MAKKTTRLDDSTIIGIGYLDMECEERKLVYGNDIIFNLKDKPNMQIGGSQIQMIDVKTNSDISLGEIVYGRGNNGLNDEGAKYKNIIFTNTLGPLLVKNPWFAEEIISIALENKDIKLEQCNLNYNLEYGSLKLLNKFVKDKE